MSTFEHIIVETKGKVGVITLNRPKMLNALSFGVFREIAVAIDDLEADEAIGCIVLAGNEKAFAAGADIKEMQPKGFIEMFSSDFTEVEQRLIPALQILQEAQRSPRLMPGLLWQGFTRPPDTADAECLARLGLDKPANWSERAYRALVNAALTRSRAISERGRTR